MLRIVSISYLAICIFSLASSSFIRMKQAFFKSKKKKQQQ